MIQTRNILIIVVIFLLLNCAALAQDSNSVQTEIQTDACKRFAMQVVSPAGNFDQRMPVMKPIEGVDYKLKVVNLCPGVPPQIADKRNFLFPPQPDTDPGKSELPPRKFTLPDVGDQQIPSEALRKFASPKLPRN